MPDITIPGLKFFSYELRGGLRRECHSLSIITKKYVSPCSVVTKTEGRVIKVLGRSSTTAGKQQLHCWKGLHTSVQSSSRSSVWHPLSVVQHDAVGIAEVKPGCTSRRSIKKDNRTQINFTKRI
jgi:hypothetical protein